MWISRTKGLALLSLIFVILGFGASNAQSVSLPSEYVQQGQHNSHLLFGVSKQVLGTYCNLEWAQGEQRCYLEFEDEQGVRTNIFIRYEKLAENESRLVARLKHLSKRWKKTYPLDFWGRSVLHPFRESNHKALDELIHGIEKEGLEHRVLMLQNSNQRPIPYFYDEELVRGVFHIFIETFSRYDLREGIWGSPDVLSYRNQLKDEDL